MANAAVKIKLMPKSPQTDLEKIMKDSKKILEEEEAQSIGFEKNPVAFGLVSLHVLFAWPEEKELDTLIENLKKTEGISSVELEDIRRAIG